MKIDQFQLCFRELCDSFDLDYEKKKGRITAFYNSKLGEIPEEKLQAVIKRASETLELKPGNLPPIKKLIDIYFQLNKRKKPHRPGENWKDSKCPHCDGTGFITEDRPDGHYILGCCKCIVGQSKQRDTTIGQELGVYGGGEAPF